MSSSDAMFGISGLDNLENMIDNLECSSPQSVARHYSGLQGYIGN